jgi:hypothetical protein
MVAYIVGKIEMDMKLLITFLALALTCINAHAVEVWKLKKETGSIKIYTADLDRSDFKSVKVECTVKGTFSQVVAALFDINRHPEWVFNCKSAKLLRTVGGNEMIYYSEVDVPWPATNRDFIAHLKAQQIAPNVVTIESHAEPVYIPEQGGLVRVKQSKAEWRMTAIGNNTIKIDYVVQFDPSGSVPAWLTNMFVTKGPMETFEKLQGRVSMQVYKNARFDFIKD